MGKEGSPHGAEREYSLAQFQGEMAELAAKEARNETKSGHFLVSGTKTRELNPEFDPSYLTEEDSHIWKGIQDGTLTIEEFRHYADAIEALDAADPVTKSRAVFSAFAGNKAMRIFF
jgi:hypothetical protein